MTAAVRRFTLRQLARASPDALSSAFRARLASQRSALAAARGALPSQLHGAVGRVERCLDSADAMSSDAAALAELEDGATCAVDELRGQSASHAPATQAFLRSVFASLVSSRALVLAAGNGEPVLPGAALHELLRDAVEDARAFCREKHGDSPETRVLLVRASGGEDDADNALLFAPFVCFATHELLKNAMGAHVRRVGADMLHECPPLELRHGTRGGAAFVSVVDFGGGLAAIDGEAAGATLAERAARFLHTTNPEREPTYTYSRNFGAPFEGLGMGLPLAGLHARYHGGALHLRDVSSSAGTGVHAGFTLRCCGDWPEPDELPFG